MIILCTAATGGPTAPETNEAAPPKQPEYYKAKEPDPNEISPLEKPTDGSKWTLFTWGLVYPIHFMCRATMPDCRQEKFRNWYPFTFCVSMVWISFYSYIMVWMITIIGKTTDIKWVNFKWLYFVSFFSSSIFDIRCRQYSRYTRHDDGSDVCRCWRQCARCSFIVSGD